VKATDFNFSTDLKLSPDTGIATFHDSRLLIFDADAIGLLRNELIEELGWQRARDLILRFGYQNGYSDFLQMRVNHTFDTEMDLLASGPVIHTWEGIVHAEPRGISFNRDTGDFDFTGVWTNSYEAIQYLTFAHPAQDPVCWSLTGYASGWCTAFFGRPLLAIEPVCVGTGDDHCEWHVQPPDVWGAQAAPYRPAFEEFWSRSDG
jgi:hypothetical protein